MSGIEKCETKPICQPLAGNTKHESLNAKQNKDGRSGNQGVRRAGLRRLGERKEQDSSQSEAICQNKANFGDAQVDVNIFNIKVYIE